MKAAVTEAIQNIWIGGLTATMFVPFPTVSISAVNLRLSFYSTRANVLITVNTRIHIFAILKHLIAEEVRLYGR